MAIHAAKNMVNPNYSEFEGRRCYASVLDIEGPVVDGSDDYLGWIGKEVGS